LIGVKALWIEENGHPVLSVLTPKLLLFWQASTKQLVVPVSCRRTLSYLRAHKMLLLKARTSSQFQQVPVGRETGWSVEDTDSEED